MIKVVYPSASEVEVTKEDLKGMEANYRKPEPLEPSSVTKPDEFLDKSRDYVALSRGPRDIVLSGPVGLAGWGPGRVFETRALAKEWCEAKYGKERVLSSPGYTRGRWSFLIKNLRAK